MLHDFLILFPLAKSLSMVFFLVFCSFLALGPSFISNIKSMQKFGQPIRNDGPKSHLQTKQGTPTMGGVLILLVFSIYVLFFARLSDALTFPMFAITILYGLIGFYDDFLKVTQRNAVGFRGKKKLLLEFVAVFVVLTIVFLNMPLNLDTDLYIPIVNKSYDLGYYYVVFAALVIVGTANAVNLTDGLDGLVTVPLIFAFSFFIIEIWCATYFGKQHSFDSITYLQLFNVAVVLAIILGCLAGFLYFNCKPAQIFMGDSGSLALGGLLGTVAVILNHEITLVVLGFIFVLEAISVMLQVGYFKLSNGKRIFKMAPIHHHFELLGWSEIQVVTRFWIISLFSFILAFFIN